MFWLFDSNNIVMQNMMENMWGKGALQCRRLRYNKARRGEATPQRKATKKTGSKVKATWHLWEFCLHLLACDIRADLYNNASFVASIVGNLIREFVWHANQCVLGPLKPTFR